MTEVKVHASRDFFKEISSEVQRIKVVLPPIQSFLDQARVRGSRIGDNELLTLLAHIESFFSVIQESSIRLEKLCESM